MKNRLIQAALLSFVLSFTSACNSKKEEPTAAPAMIDKEQIKKDIQAKEDEFAATYNSGEEKNIGYYADDATSFSQNRAPLVGKTAIIDYIKTGKENSDKGTKISFVTNEVFPSTDGNQVVEVGYYKLVDSLDATINSGNYIILFEKRDGKYMSLREMSASDIPLE